jgi:signal peptidase I
MLPRLLIGDYLFITKWNYGYSKHSLPWSLPLIPAAFSAARRRAATWWCSRRPNHNGEDWIKRVIGLPGDTCR